MSDSRQELDWRRMGRLQRSIMESLDSLCGDEVIALWQLAAVLRGVGFRGEGEAWVRRSARPLVARGLVWASSSGALALTVEGRHWCNLDHAHGSK